MVLVGTDERTPTYLGSDFLRARPSRSPYVNWKRTKKGVTVYTGGKKISLDSIGATVWEACDGSNTVEDIARILNQRFMLGVGEAENSLSIYFGQLVKKRLIFLRFGEAQATTEGPLFSEMPPMSNESTVFCGYCGAQNSGISNFCLKCGRRLVK